MFFTFSLVKMESQGFQGLITWPRSLSHMLAVQARRRSLVCDVESRTRIRTPATHCNITPVRRTGCSRRTANWHARDLNRSTLGISSSEALSHAWSRSTATAATVSSVASLHDEDIRCSVCPRPPPVRSGFRSFAQRERFRAVRLKLPSSPFNLNYMLCVIASKGRWDFVYDRFRNHGNPGRHRTRGRHIHL